MKTSINIMFLALIGTSIKEYAKQMGQPDLEKVTLGSTVFLRNFPESYHDIDMHNEWVPQYFPVEISDSL